MDMLDWLHEKVKRLGDAVYSLEEIHAHPEWIEILKQEKEQARTEFQLEKVGKPLWIIFKPYVSHATHQKVRNENQ